MELTYKRVIVYACLSEFDVGVGGDLVGGLVHVACVELSIVENKLQINVCRANAMRFHGSTLLKLTVALSNLPFGCHKVNAREIILQEKQISIYI